MKPVHSAICLLLSLPLLAVSCSSCTRTEGKNPESVEKGFVLSATMQRELKLGTVRQQPVRDELNLTGVISSDEDKTVKVFPLAGGAVEKLNVELGDHVTKGQVLAVIKSGETADLENDAAQAQAGLVAARRSYDAAQDLYKAGLASERDLVAARQDWQKAQASVERASKQLNLYNVGKDGRYTVTAPISGTIIDKNVTAGMQFRADNVSNLFTIADLSDVWIMANVFESDIAKVQAGYDVVVKTLAYPDRVFHGKIDRVFNILDPDSKVMKVRVRLDNPDYALKPEMYAELSVTNTEANHLMLAVPAQAIVFDKNRNYVLVYHDPAHIDPREVTLAKTVGDVAYLARGVREGERVITKNQLLIYDQLTD